jgi:ubiquinone/menaquinone biosynthesis C-methylase UbiE
MDLDEYRKASHEVWGQVAEVWGREREYLWRASHAVGERLVERLDPQSGQTILELAAGTGDTGFAAAERLGDSGRLVSTDFAAPMVEAARSGGSALGLENVEYRVLDAERMDLDEDGVDGVLCRWGFMLMADPAAAFAETRRVLRDGGRLCFSVWSTPDRNLWASTAGSLLVEQGHLPPPEPGAPGIFAMADPARIRELVTGAGFSEPELEEVAVEWEFPSVDDYWTFITEIAGPIALTVNGLEEADRERFREELVPRATSLLSDYPGAMNGLTINVTTA